jgi:hypothetical protein
MRDDYDQKPRKLVSTFKIMQPEFHFCLVFNREFQEEENERHPVYTILNSLITSSKEKSIYSQKSIQNSKTLKIVSFVELHLISDIQGIYIYIPKTNNVSQVYSVPAIL